MKYNYLSFLIFTFFCFSNQLSIAQERFTVEGIIMTEGEPVPFAQVAMMKHGEKTPIGGGITDINGKFTIKIAKGNYDLLVSFVGFKDKIIENIAVEQSMQLETISIEEDIKMVEEVIVEADQIRSPVTTTMEGLEIKPDQTISNVGGTLLDVLRNTPSVRVGEDGSVSIRGSGNTNVLIDGRNSSLSSDLEQIPASAIKNIQIINNPNAKYDAQAAGGILNIELKKGENKGKSGSAELTYGTRERMNAAIRGGINKENFRISGGYSFRRWPSIGNGTSLRETFNDDEYFEQFRNSERDDIEHTFNISSTFYAGKKNKFSYEGVFNVEDENDYDSRQTRLSQLSNGNLLTQYIRENDEIESNFTIDNALIYEREFDQKGRDLRVVISNSFRDDNEKQFINVYNDAFELSDLARDPNNLQRSNSDGKRGTSIFQLDYEQSIFSGKLETGLKSILRSIDNDFLYEVRNEETGAYEVRNPTNQFLYKDQVYAGYVIYSRKMKNWNVAMGVRAEQTFIETELVNTNTTNNQSYLDFFPSFQTSYKFNDSNTFKFTYSRRIDRPRSRSLNPFRDVSDSLNVRVGDPNLQPEYINSFEVGHTFNKNKFTLTTNSFYRKVNNQVDWIVRVEDGISIRGPQNLNTMETYGLELISTLTIFDWWSVNASYSLFYTQVDGSNLDDSFTNSGSSWYAKMNSDFNLPFGVDMQITGNYSAPEIEAQGRDLARYYLDLSFQKKFMDKKLVASLSLQDIFNTNNFRGENFGTDFRQTYLYNRETQIFLATVRYAVGKQPERKRGRGRRR